MENLKHFIAASEKADPRIKRQQMFGDDLQKELDFAERHEKIKE